MWDYSFMFPSVIILFTLLVFYFSRPRLSIRMNRTYLGMLLLEISIIGIDLLSSIADENYSSFKPWMLYVLNTAFFMLYLARAPLFFCYTTEVLRLRDKRLYCLFLPFILCECAALSSFATGALFSIQNGMYTRGAAYDLLFYCYLFYILASLVLILLRSRTMKPRDIAGCLGFNVALLVGTVIRKLAPKLLVMNTFSLVGLLITYLSFQNPDRYLSERGQAFNIRGFALALEEVLQRNDYHILAFVIRNYNHERGIYGGVQTDRAIAMVNQYLRQKFPSCMPFYLRGGRFALLGPESLDWAGIHNRVSERFQSKWDTDSGSIFLHIGFSEIKAHPRLDSADRIVNNLNLALETVGGNDASAPNNLVMDTDSIQQLDEEIDILHTLENAIDREEVEIFLQPVYQSSTRSLIAAEALCRIHDESGRIIPPGLFIPLAEKSGLINQLGAIVFKKTCEFIHGHDMKALGLQWINVNLSPVQCLRLDLAEQLSGILKHYNLQAEQIHLEITEQSIIDYTLMKEQIDMLRRIGFHFVLDDYGSGYSNLTRVKHYPFWNIKLDMEVVWDYCKTRDTLLPHIVTAFKELGFSITAEGIETEAMADALAGIGCDYLQGYLFDKPLPVDGFVAKYMNHDL